MYDALVTTVDDWLALPELVIPRADYSRGISGVVLDVEEVSFCAVSKYECEQAGLNAESTPGGRRVLPVITVREAGDYEVYRLPLSLTSWAIMVVSLIKMGRKVLPSKVEFGEVQEQLIAKVESLTNRDAAKRSVRKSA
ncbi:hypothetical protein [Hahella sp. NBU794]|uniref:hypothetical protein n=1 Tax=Hahella sp. NBU794 TaxID=3422590 RepID=UPI003D6F32A1